MSLFNGIDLDGFSSPALGDLDADGDLDLIVGTDGLPSVFARNIGSPTNPRFEEFQTNPFGIEANFSAGIFAPTLVDIDNDSDLDLFVSDVFGTTYFFRNDDSATEPSFAAPEINPFSLIVPLSFDPNNPGVFNGNTFFAHPTFVDIDGDGDSDAFFSVVFTGILFFENIGTPNNPNFAPVEFNPFGLGSVERVNYALSFADADHDGDFDLFLGTENGEILFLGNNGNA